VLQTTRHDNRLQKMWRNCHKISSPSFETRHTTIIFLALPDGSRISISHHNSNNNNNNNCNALLYLGERNRKYLRSKTTIRVHVRSISHKNNNNNYNNNTLLCLGERNRKNDLRRQYEYTCGQRNYNAIGGLTRH
jgi:hypothetical protein